VTLAFVDTNVLLYAYDAGAGAKHHAARELAAQLAADKAGAISVQVLQEFYANARSKLRVPLSQADAIVRLKVLSSWVVHSPTAVDVVEAARIAERNTISFWDAMVVRSASVLRCGTLWTEDLNDGQLIEGVRVANPFAA
jgi:predicted nucleic acid-binding protein